MKTRGKERVTAIRTYIATELNARYWNPKWIREMQKAGYAGARAIANNMENLYGWQATSAEHMDGTFWQNSYDVYVADKNGLGMDKFFEQANPHARQVMMARMLEVDRQDRTSLRRNRGPNWFADTCRQSRRLARPAPPIPAESEVASVHREQAALVPGLGTTELAAFGRNMAKATGWKRRRLLTRRRPCEQAFKKAWRGPRSRASHGKRRCSPPSSPPLPYVNGFRMAQQVFRTTCRERRPAAGIVRPDRADCAADRDGLPARSTANRNKGYLMTNLYQLTVSLFYQWRTHFFGRLQWRY